MKSLFKLNKIGSAILFGFLLSLILFILIDIGVYFILKSKETKSSKNTPITPNGINNKEPNISFGGDNDEENPNEPHAVDLLLSSRTNSQSSVLDTTTEAKNLNETAAKPITNSSRSNEQNNSSTTRSSSPAIPTHLKNLNLSNTNNKSVTFFLSPPSSDRETDDNNLVIEPTENEINMYCISKNIAQHYLRKDEAETAFGEKNKEVINTFKIDLSDGIDIVWIKGKKSFYPLKDRSVDSSQRTHYEFDGSFLITNNESCITYYNENSTVYEMSNHSVGRQSTNQKYTHILETIGTNGGKTYRYVNYDYNTKKIGEIKPKETLKETNLDGMPSHKEAQQSDKKSKEPPFTGPIPTGLPGIETAYKTYQAAAPVVQQLTNYASSAAKTAAGYLFIPNNQSPPNATINATSINDNDDEIVYLSDPTNAEIESLKDGPGAFIISVLYTNLEKELGISIERANLIRSGEKDHNPGIYKVWVNEIPCFQDISSYKIYKLEDCSTEIIISPQDKVTYYDVNSTAYLCDVVGNNQQSHAICKVILKTYETNNRISYKRVFYNDSENKIIQLTKGEYKAICNEHQKEFELI